MREIGIIVPMLISFAVSVVMAPLLIPVLVKLKAGQTVRDDGPKTHLKKSGTPTMGGIVILVSVTVTSLLYADEYRKMIPVLFLTLGFGMIGFLDDFIKVILKRSMGLSPLQKLSLQILVTSLFAYYMVNMSGISLAMRIPFLKGQYIDFGILNVPLLFLVVIGTANGTNFTDGVDGLSTCVTIAVALFFTIAAVFDGNSVCAAGGAMIGALLGFLLYNAHPAKVFMGDTGSLALGGFVVGMAYTLQLPLFIPIVGFIYLLEVVSVILQVVYFKKTHGKRLFRMAPIHHHFELGGYSEVQVVALFTIITTLLGAVALLGLW